MMGRRGVTGSASLVFVACAVVVLFTMGPVARADDTSIAPFGGTVRPMRPSDIRLDAETVQAVCLGGFAEYRVDFRFVNDGKARSVRLGFPFSGELEEGGGPGEPVGFQAWKDGCPLQVNLFETRSHGANVGYYVHDAWFRHGATMITVSYIAGASGTASSRLGAADQNGGFAGWYQYWLHTGGTWAGPIGKAVVRYTFADTFRGRAIDLTKAEAAEYAPVTSPSGWTRSLPRTCEWVFSDFEPKATGGREWWQTQSGADITLGFTNPSDWARGRTRWTCSSYARGFAMKHPNGGFWCEGVPGPGVGEWMQATFPHARRVRELRILPGCDVPPTAFRQFGRPKTLRAVFSDGSSRLLHLEDSPTLQRFRVNALTTSVRLAIESAYPGTDYPGTCVSIAEFGRRPAPGYAPFARLIADPKATGRLTAWAGGAASPPVTPPAPSTWYERYQYDALCGGDLIGTGEFGAFTADEAPFRQPSTLAALLGRAPGLRLPDEALAGAVTRVTAISNWTYEIRYSSGVDLFVNTRPLLATRLSLVKQLVRETQGMSPYADGRKVPFDIVTVGRQAVGLVRPGVIPCDCSSSSGEDTDVPAQVFWRTKQATFHVYAGSRGVTIDRLMAVARSMIVRPAAAPAVVPAASPSHWWLGLALGEAAVVGAIVLLVVWGRRKTAS